MKSLSPRFRKLLISAMAVLIVIGVVALVTSDREPTYGGESLSHWVASYQTIGQSGFLPASDRDLKAQTAIREIGTNAIPFLLEWMKWEPNFLQEFVRLRDSALPHWVRRQAIVRLLLAPYHRARNTPNAFHALGHAAAPAVPALRAQLAPGNSGSTIQRAYFSLAGIGKPAVPVFREAFEDPELDPMEYRTLVQALYDMGRGLEELTPTFRNNFNHTNDSIVVATYEFFNARRQAINPDDIIPTLNANWDNPNLEIRRANVRAIGLYGDETFLPALTNALTDADPQVRYNATAAINEIAKPYE